MRRARWCLLGGLIAVTLLGGMAWLFPAGAVRAVEWLSHIPRPGAAGILSAEGIENRADLVEVQLGGLGVEGPNLQPVVFLREKGGERYLQAVIGSAEARAIAIALEGVTPPRPLTHDLLRATIEALGGKVKAVLIDDLREGIFYAKVVVSLQERSIELDSRLSDGVALALRAGAPIYARERLLERGPGLRGVEGSGPM